MGAVTFRSVARSGSSTESSNRQESTPVQFKNDKLCDRIGELSNILRDSTDPRLRNQAVFLLASISQLDDRKPLLPPWITKLGRDPIKPLSDLAHELRSQLRAESNPSEQIKLMNRAARALVDNMWNTKRHFNGLCFSNYDAPAIRDYHADKLGAEAQERYHARITAGGNNLIELQLSLRTGAIRRAR